jgi:hypothetical protein
MYFAVGGAVAYVSWPLAFIVNPALAGSGLASSFEGRGQPFAWLFIMLDCVAGLCMVIVSARILRSLHGNVRSNRGFILVLLSYAAFGIATAADALVPLNCGSASVQACARQLWPLTPDDILTGLAELTLSLAVGTVIVRAARRRTDNSSVVPRSLAVLFIGWGLSGLAVFLSSSAEVGAASQYAFLTLTGVLIAVVPLGITSPRRHLDLVVGPTTGTATTARPITTPPVLSQVIMDRDFGPSEGGTADLTVARARGDRVMSGTAHPRCRSRRRRHRSVAIGRRRRRRGRSPARQALVSAAVPTPSIGSTETKRPRAFTTLQISARPGKVG